MADFSKCIARVALDLSKQFLRGRLDGSNISGGSGKKGHVGQSIGSSDRALFWVLE